MYTKIDIPYKTEYTMNEKEVRPGILGMGNFNPITEEIESILYEPVNEVKLYPHSDNPIPFTIRTEKSPLLYKGESEVITPGENGIERVFVDEEGILVGSEIIKQPKPQVERVGNYKRISITPRENPKTADVLADDLTDLLKVPVRYMVDYDESYNFSGKNAIVFYIGDKPKQRTLDLTKRIDLFAMREDFYIEYDRMEERRSVSDITYTPESIYGYTEANSFSYHTNEGYKSIIFREYSDEGLDKGPAVNFIKDVLPFGLFLLEYLEDDKTTPRRYINYSDFTEGVILGFNGAPLNSEGLTKVQKDFSNLLVDFVTTPPEQRKIQPKGSSANTRFVVEVDNIFDFHAYLDEISAGETTAYDRFILYDDKGDKITSWEQVRAAENITAYNGFQHTVLNFSYEKLTEHKFYLVFNKDNDLFLTDNPLRATNFLRTPTTNTFYDKMREFSNGPLDIEVLNQHITQQPLS